MSATEYVVLVNDQDEEIGIAEKLSAHQHNFLHRAFSVFIFKKNPELQLLIQQRALNKYHCPGLWTNTCCSHPRPGESVLAAATRRLNEEFGITALLNYAGMFHYNSHFANGLSENEIDHVLTGTIPADTVLAPNKYEIESYRWVSLAELNKELEEHNEQFTPWFKAALEVVKQHPL